MAAEMKLVCEKPKYPRTGPMCMCEVCEALRERRYQSCMERLERNGAFNDVCDHCKGTGKKPGGVPWQAKS